MEEYEARVPGASISQWAPHKRRSKKSGWAVGGKAFVDYFICSPAGAETTSRAKAVPEYYVARQDLEQSTIARRDAKTTDYTDLAGKKSGLCAMQLSPCCSLVAVASMAEVGPPNVMGQSSHGERMAG